MLWYITTSIAMGLSFLLIYIFYMRKGQFSDPEDVKFQMLREDEDGEINA